jgi:hypothetical protein
MRASMGVMSARPDAAKDPSAGTPGNWPEPIPYGKATSHPAIPGLNWKIAPQRGLSGEDLLAQDVGMAAVLSELAQDVQVHPAQRQRPAAVAVNGVVESEGRGGAA